MLEQQLDARKLERADSPFGCVVMMIVMMIMMMARVIGDTKHGGGLAPVSEWPLPPRSVQTRHCCEPGPVAGAANKRLLSSLLSLSSPRHVPHHTNTANLETVNLVIQCALIFQD